jgi:hypothetical protein
MATVICGYRCTNKARASHANAKHGPRQLPKGESIVLSAQLWYTQDGLRGHCLAHLGVLCGNRVDSLCVTIPAPPCRSD